MGDRQQPFGGAHQEDGIPFQALGRVQGRQFHTPFIGLDLVLGAFFHFSDELRDIPRGRVLRPGHDRPQIPPALLSRPARRRLRRPAHRLQLRSHGLDQGRGRLRVRELRSGREHAHRIAHILALEEGPAVRQGDGDPPRGEGLLEGLRLTVRPEEDRDRIGSHP